MRLRRFVTPFTIAPMAVLLATPAAGQEERPPAPVPVVSTQAAPPAYAPPPHMRAHEAPESEDRPLLAALRTAVGSLPDEGWTRASVFEVGSDIFENQFARLFEKERVKRLAAGFREGWVQVFLKMPATVTVQVVDMGSPEVAHDFFLINTEFVQEQLNATEQAEDASVKHVSRLDPPLAGTDEAHERIYDLLVGDLPPTRTQTLLARSGRHVMIATFMQTTSPPEAARAAIATLAGRLPRDGS